MDSLIDFDKLPLAVVGMSNLAYHSKKGFDGRSFLEAVAKYGGEAQLWMDMGYSLFSGNAATSTGSEFDELITGVLEGKRFDDLVVVAPEEVLGSTGSRNTKAYREWAAAQTGLCVTADIKWKYQKMYDSMMGNDAAYGLISRTVRTQRSVFFEAFDHRLKVRPDAETEELWWDLKTTSSQWDRLFRSVLDYGYSGQAWLYTQGAMALGYSHFRMPFVFVQTMAPYACRVYTLPDDLVERAGQRLVGVMEEVRLRRSTGVYKPADADQVLEMEIPQWALKTEEVVEL
jgi:hypothetical protein